MIGRFTATGVVIASMVGTGVFVALGYQAASIKSTFAILLLWVLGGVYALCGAFCYAELASRMPRSGGEYHFLSRIYHPALGFLAGWATVTVGFAALTAVAALAFASYMSILTTDLNEQLMAVGMILLCGCMHMGKAEVGRSFQNGFTAIKIVLLFGLMLMFLFLTIDPQPVSLLPGKGDLNMVLTMEFATAFVFVTYSFSGWNAAVYVAGEIRRAKQIVPYALLGGTTLILALYLLLNYAFLQSIPFAEIEALESKENIAALAVGKIFSGQGEIISNLLISISLISTVGALVFISPRISQAIGEDFKPLSFLSRKNKNGIPVTAICAQLFLSILFVLASNLQSILMYVEFTLISFSFLTVFGLFLLRRKCSGSFEGYMAWGFPWTPLLFLLMSGWVLVSVFSRHTLESCVGLLTILAGLALYFLSSRSSIK
ncbi:MAG: amino acid permease [Opitutae bacterium]|nr:amino acid permease [Opitutae bacterium]